MWPYPNNSLYITAVPIPYPASLLSQDPLWTLVAMLRAINTPSQVVSPVLPPQHHLMMGQMGTSTASMGEMLEVGGTTMAHLAHALPATLASMVQTVLPTPVLPAALPLMMGLMETSTASMGEMLEDGGKRMAHLAPALPATLASVVQTVLSVQ